jgi:ATPase subunit of ABC transporter with duplicated ATPase domains
MSIVGPAYELYGVSASSAGPIADGVHVPLTRDITALYGLNGAGKSRLLNGIACALTGVMPPADAMESARWRICMCALPARPDPSWKPP